MFKHVGTLIQCRSVSQSRKSELLSQIQNRLQKKDGITSVRALVMEKKLSKEIEYEEAQAAFESKKKLEERPWKHHKRVMPGHNPRYQNRRFLNPRENCFNYEKWNKNKCPMCKEEWFPKYTDGPKLERYMDLQTRKYNVLYRHRPGNVYYERDNPHWDHKPTPSPVHEKLQLE